MTRPDAQPRWVRLPRANLRLYPQEGHLSIAINQFPQVLADFTHSNQNEAA